jgi:hypothetical protein
MPAVNLARALLLVSVASFGLIGLAYLVVPGTMLSIVGIEADATTDFLMRTEGVALLTGAIFIWAARDGQSAASQIVLLGLGFYFIVGSVVDLAAWTQGVVGQASVPSAVARIVIGGLCLLSVALLRRGDRSATPGEVET